MTGSLPAGQPISEQVARLLCPEAFRARDQFEEVMQRLVASAGASNESVDRLKQQVMELAGTIGLSVSQAADRVVARQEAVRQVIADGYLRGTQRTPESAS